MNGTANGLYGGDLPNQINTPWIDFSEQSTIVGWSSFTTKSIRYKIVGNIVYVLFTIMGTSNSATTNFTVPLIIKNNIVFINYSVDNGIGGLGLGYMTSANINTISFQRYSALNTQTPTWTASGNKQIIGQFFYEI
jgi:hypothetical protein